MTEYTIEKNTLTGIANAVRKRAGKAGLIKVTELEKEILNIPSEGGDNYLVHANLVDDVIHCRFWCDKGADKGYFSWGNEIVEVRSISSIDPHVDEYIETDYITLFRPSNLYGWRILPKSDEIIINRKSYTYNTTQKSTFNDLFFYNKTKPTESIISSGVNPGNSTSWEIVFDVIILKDYKNEEV